MGLFGSPVPFLFAAFSVAVVGAKIGHLVAHVSTVPHGAFALYLPTFFFLDFIAICAVRLLLHNGRGTFFMACAVVGSIISLISVGGSAAQLGFQIKTGGELQWRDAQSYTNKEGMTVLVSGTKPVIGFSVLIFAIAFIGRNILHDAFGNFLHLIGNYVLSVARFVKKLATTASSWVRSRTRRSPQIDNHDANMDYSTEMLLAKDSSHASDDYDDDQSEDSTLLGEGSPGKNLEMDRSRRRRCGIPLPAWIFLLAATVYLTVAHIVRPPKPYNYMSVTLPVAMLDAFKGNEDYCFQQRLMWHNEWPFPELIDESQWEDAHANFKGWAPGPKSALAAGYRNTTPDWLPKKLPRGFFRWDPLRFEKGFWGSHTPHIPHHKPHCYGVPDREPFYNPIDDPMKITNLDTEILEPLREPLANGTVKIKNVVLILMESLRQELFPLQHGSEIFKTIMESNKGEDAAMLETVNKHLSEMTPHIEQITGVSGNFKDPQGAPYPLPEMKWKDPTPNGFGGINVVGAHTGATMSTKSYGSTHCGAWPMAVEKFAEAESDSYQPCIPQILELFNNIKDKKPATADDDFQDQQWYPALFEAEVEEYDRQEVFDRKLGWEKIFTRKQLEAGPYFDKSNVLYHKVNYFGYPEPVLKPYITEYIRNATANNQRIFMSHFTSTTHHAWDTPKDFPHVRYISDEGLNKWHRDFNKYLNTIRYHDRWMGELMQLFEDVGIANETLVVFVGDHGQAFKEDFHKTATYENPHITNFRVPIVFKHPQLPRVQYNATVSSISILPTILDLLINSGSLNSKDAAAASDFIQDYEGQSLIRPYKTTHKGRRAWTFSIVNSGAGMLGVTSADVDWRLVMPLEKVFEYRVSNMVKDPMERKAVSAWTYDDLLDGVLNDLGKDAKAWTEEAVAVANWWVQERKRLWRYHTLPHFPGMEGLN